MQQININKNNKKTAIISYGNRITLFSEHVRSVVLVYIREFYINALKREQVDYLSRITKKEADLDYYKNISNYTNDNINEYDELIIYNSPFNLFGGIFSKECLDTMIAISKFKGEIYYLLDDPKFPCVDVGTLILNRAKKIENGIAYLPLDKDEFYEMPVQVLEDFSNRIWPNIITAFAGIDYQIYYDTWNKSHRTQSVNNKLISDAKWVYIDLNTYMAVTELPHLKLKNYDKSSVKYDLVYYGNNRHTERDKIIKSIYSNSNTRNLMYGYKMDWQNCDYHDYVPHDVLYEHCCKNAWATIILGDVTHNNTLLTVRFFESMMIDLVGFIYLPYDKDKKFIQNQELKDFIYFSNNKELEDKLNKIKNDLDYYRHIVNLEREEINRMGFDYKQYIKTKSGKLSANALF